jgi:hypothetical protein
MRLLLVKDLKIMNLMARAVCLCSLLILGATLAYPCSCLQISHRKEFRSVDAIFSGQVIEITRDDTYKPPKLKVSPYLQKLVDSTKRYIVRFKVEQKFKGVGGKEISLNTYQGDMPCLGMTFTEGERYLIYAYCKEGGFDADLCSRTRALDKTSKEYRELNSAWFRFKARLPVLS